MNFDIPNGTININGQIYAGRKAAIVNGRVIIDGVDQSVDTIQGPISAVVHGTQPAGQASCAVDFMSTRMTTP